MIVVTDVETRRAQARRRAADLVVMCVQRGCGTSLGTARADPRQPYRRRGRSGRSTEGFSSSGGPCSSPSPAPGLVKVATRGRLWARALCGGAGAGAALHPPGMDLLRALKRRLARKPRQGVQIQVRKERMGNEYGGYMVCPDGIDASSVVYSFGIGEDISFDLAVNERFGVAVHAFDPTPRSIAWLRAQNLPAGFSIHEYGLAGYDGVARFTPPENPAHISHTMLTGESNRPQIEVPVRRLSSITAELGHSRIDILKVDIEGAEYAALDDLLETGPLPRQILIEFHHHMSGVALAQTERALDRLNQAGYRVFDVSRTAYEFSLIRSIE